MLFYIIEQEQMVQKAWEEVVKAAGHEVYTTEQVGDFQYIAEDMQPALFLCSSVTLRSELSTFMDVYTQSTVLKSVPVVLVGDAIEEINAFLIIKKPFRPIEALEMILNRLSK